MERKIGEVFISKLTGKRAVVVSDSIDKFSCHMCIYYEFCRNSGIKLELRLIEGGQCVRGNRSTYDGIIFKEIEQLYTISKETLGLLDEILNNDNLKEEEKLNYILYILDLECVLGITSH